MIKRNKKKLCNTSFPTFLLLYSKFTAMNFFNFSLNSAFSEGLYAWLVVHLDNSVVHSSVSCCALPMGLSSLASYSSWRVQHPGRGEKVTRRIWEGSVWASLTLMNREGLNSFQLGLVLYWEQMILFSSSGLHNPSTLACFLLRLKLSDT